MATQSPFPFLDGLLDKLGSGLQPPAWLVDEVQQRAVLFLNHVLMQEKEARDRLVRQQGRVVLVQWRSFLIKLAATPAGLLERAGPDAAADLTLTVTESSPLGLAQAALRGDKPAVRIEGDVQLAAEVNWLVDHVRWDAEEDLSRLIGDAPAHTLGQVARRGAEALRQFVAARVARPAASPPGPGQAHP
jgi:ubiquinone biosynthesis protein UbiJ